MSRHRMFQNYDYEGELDDFDGQNGQEDDGEEELSPEDKVQMAAGTAEIISLLGPQADKVTTQQIHDALWHYYYDTDKSVAYLIGKFVDPTPTPAAKPKAPQAKPSARTCISQFLPVTPARQQVFSEADSRSREPTMSMATFFADMPWLNIPEDRRTTFVPPLRPRGGLLGGSSTPKLSKLQSLAAARKRKADAEATLVLRSKEGNVPSVDQSNSQPSQRGGQEGASSHGTARKKTKNQPATEAQEEEERVQDLTSQGLTPQEDALAWPYRPRPRPQTDGAFDEVIMAKPSAFAQVLCFGSASRNSPASSSSTPVHVPWTAFTTPDALREAFEQPSPDDIVLAAQAQSALSQPQSKSAPSQGRSLN